jgi:hypothetical protein
MCPGTSAANGSTAMCPSSSTAMCSGIIRDIKSNAFQICYAVTRVPQGIYVALTPKSQNNRCFHFLAAVPSVDGRAVPALSLLPLMQQGTSTVFYPAGGKTRQPARQLAVVSLLPTVELPVPLIAVWVVIAIVATAAAVVNRRRFLHHRRRA